MREERPRWFEGIIADLLVWGEQHSLARCLGTSDTTVSRALNGEGAPPMRLPCQVNDLEKLQQLFGRERFALLLGAVCNYLGHERPALLSGAVLGESFDRARMRLRGALAELDLAVLAAYEDDGAIDATEAGALVEDVDRSIDRLGEIRAHLVAVRDRERGPLQLAGSDS